MPAHALRVDAPQVRKLARDARPAVSEPRSLLERIAPWVFELVQRVESDAERRADLYQETMLSVWVSASREESDGGGFAVALEVARDVARTYTRMRQTEDAMEHVPMEEAGLRSEDDPEREVMQKELGRALLAELGEVERNIFVLSVRGFTIEDIHVATGLPRSTVRNRLESSRRFFSRWPAGRFPGVTAVGRSTPSGSSGPIEL